MALASGCTVMNVPRSAGAGGDGGFRSVYDPATHLTYAAGGETAEVRRPLPPEGPPHGIPDDAPWAGLRRWAHSDTRPDAPWAGLRRWVREQERR